MDIIEKIGDTITEKGKVAADKAKELAAIANLKSQISTCEEVMKKNFWRSARFILSSTVICLSLLLRSSVKPLRTASVPLQICRRKSIS
jgi:hypothetical protein